MCRKGLGRVTVDSEEVKFYFSVQCTKSQFNCLSLWCLYLSAPSSRRIVILGKTGDGKSSVGNTIFGTEQFDISHSFNSGESPCQAKTQHLNGKEITLIDTPGFFDTKIPEKKLKPEIVRCITECLPGPHAFLIVIKYGRFSKQENEIFNQITEYFSEEVFKFATIVFTHGDNLPEGKKIKDYISHNANLSELVKKCGGRCHVIDNKYWNKDSDNPYRTNSYQVNKILESIEEIVNANDGNCYTNEMLKIVDKIKKHEEKQIANSSGNMSEEETRQEAKNRVWKFLTKVAGISTGLLLGAFFGAVRACLAFISLFKSVGNLDAAASGINVAAAALTNSAGTGTGITSTTVAGTVGITVAAVLGAGSKEDIRGTVEF
ncbi:GTPase IMAP family member 7-like [Cyprinodon tularosa]|uniref:GTPase IMAP family member 7-like n=1 Tax=Cyprinodon tularosa TaxID=77115 RepID=UPI0018E276FB|nr:GTPase IMAP family member 7-like [Cyprinodon tularosa]